MSPSTPLLICRFRLLRFRPSTYMPANIGLQRTSACGLAAEAGSFGDRGMPHINLPLALRAIVFFVAALAAVPIGAENTAASRSLRVRLGESQICAPVGTVIIVRKGRQ